MVGVVKRTPKSMGGRLLLDSTHRASMRGLLQRARHLHSFSVVGMATRFPLMHKAFQTRLPNISWFGYGGGIPSRNLGHGHALVLVIRWPLCRRGSCALVSCRKMFPSRVCPSQLWGVRVRDLVGTKPRYHIALRSRLCAHCTNGKGLLRFRCSLTMRR